MLNRRQTTTWTNDNPVHWRVTRPQWVNFFPVSWPFLYLRGNRMNNRHQKDLCCQGLNDIVANNRSIWFKCKYHIVCDQSYSCSITEKWWSGGIWSATGCPFVTHSVSENGYNFNIWSAAEFQEFSWVFLNYVIWSSITQNIDALRYYEGIMSM